MKLKNKLSGEIKEFTLFDGNELQGGVTLESLTKEWEDVPEEEWKPIPGYEGYYEVSSLGEVRSLDKEIKANLVNNEYVNRPGKTLKQKRR